MTWIAAGLGASLAVFDQFVDWLRSRGRFAPRAEPKTSDREIPVDPGLAELLLMLEWPDEKLAPFALQFAMSCSPYKHEPRLVAGCERLVRIGLARRGPDADHIVNAALHGLQWLDVPARIEPFEPSVFARDDLRETTSWLREPTARRRRREKAGR